MEPPISTLTRSDFDQLDRLMKENSRTLGVFAAGFAANTPRGGPQSLDRLATTPRRLPQVAFMLPNPSSIRRASTCRPHLASVPLVSTRSFPKDPVG